MKISKSNINTFLLFLLVKICFDYSVLNFLPINYMYSISYGIDFSTVKYIISFFVFIVFLIVYLFFFRNTNFISMFVFNLFLFSFLPINSLFGLANYRTLFFIVIHLFWILLLCVGASFQARQFNPSILFVKIKKKFLPIEYITILLFFVISFFVYNYNGLRVSFNLSIVYEIRRIAGRTSCRPRAASTPQMFRSLTVACCPTASMHRSGPMAPPRTAISASLTARRSRSMPKTTGYSRPARYW